MYASAENCEKIAYLAFVDPSFAIFTGICLAPQIPCVTASSSVLASDMHVYVHNCICVCAVSYICFLTLALMHAHRGGQTRRMGVLGRDSSRWKKPEI